MELIDNSLIKNYNDIYYMDEIKYTIAVVLGGAITFVGNYFLESRRIETEKFKFSLNKVIEVGEEYFKFSTYSLIYFTSLIDTIGKREDYLSSEAHSALEKVDEEYKKQMEKIRENNIVTTTASIYFNVTGPEKAVSEMLRTKSAIVKMTHGNATQDYDLYQEGHEEYITVIKSIIDQIKVDQLTITTQIRKLLSGNPK
jgi:hypothetical protein